MGIDRFPDTYDDWYFPENFPEKLNSRIQAHTITLVPSANWIKKRWPVEHWKKLITLLSEYHFLILGGSGAIPSAKKSGPKLLNGEQTWQVKQPYWNPAT